MDRFVSASSEKSAPGQAPSAEEILREQTVGLVQLSDYRKRRAEALERKEFEGTPLGSGASTPTGGASTPQPLVKKKKRKVVPKGGLSFSLDDDDDLGISKNSTPRGGTPTDSSAVSSETDNAITKKKPGANKNVGFKPRLMTKTGLLREAQHAEAARKEFLATRDAVKATEVVIPFVFYDGTNIPGGRCRVRKGEQIWLFLDKARKVGAELGVGGDKSRRDWARVSVDDLMLVRGEIIVPHHYEFYHFIFNKVVGYSGPLFDYSAERTKASPSASGTESGEAADYNPLERADKKISSSLPDVELEGYSDDPTITKVVDRRWYEKNKHIFPASVWEEYDPEKNLSGAQRKDTSGNAFFFS
ncbi:XAP5-domain-containing protein [Amniculicola lignicola CBS 123094]|uniref:XAP5-domain-containing protein n=1 Tax=Amniculicola lignicola CBS 123094 TaxID=1392246 RepID=A0A6A5WQW9_9PLEO|nr:XAP5-domain-containing protein [Amniculicola lignicola CBS 123094]